MPWNKQEKWEIASDSQAMTWDATESSWSVRLLDDCACLRSTALSKPQTGSAQIQKPAGMTAFFGITTMPSRMK